MERVEFIGDRTVRRQVSIDLLVPDYAPRFASKGDEFLIIPISLMRKQTLINFDLRDQDGHVLSLLNLRQNQAITNAMLQGLALSNRTVNRGLSQDEADLIFLMVFGDRKHVQDAHGSFESDRAFENLRNDEVLRVVVDRLKNSWLMCVLLPVKADARRVIKFSYDEPLTLHVQKPPEFKPKEGGEWELHFQKRRARLRELSSGLGLMPARVRFPIVGAESAQSYHLNVTAPSGVEIRTGQALSSRISDESDAAGDDEDRRQQPFAAKGLPYDEVGGALPSVDLHLCDVKTGSISIAQVELSAQRGGLLKAMAAACLLNSILLLAVALYYRRPGSSVPDISLLLVFTSLGTTFLAQQDTHALLAKLLWPARLLAAVSSVCALFMAARIVLYQREQNEWWLITPALASLLPLLVLIFSVVLSGLRRRQSMSILSPWDFDMRSSVIVKKNLRERPQHFETGRRELGLDKPAIEVESAESERRRGQWTGKLEDEAGERLRGAIAALE